MAKLGVIDVVVYGLPVTTIYGWIFRDDSGEDFPGNLSEEF